MNKSQVNLLIIKLPSTFLVNVIYDKYILIMTSALLEITTIGNIHANIYIYIYI